MDDQTRFGKAWGLIVANYAPYRALGSGGRGGRGRLGEHADRATAVRNAILRAHSLTATAARANPARLGNDRERYDLAGRIVVESNADYTAWKANMGRIAATARQIRAMGMDVPHEMGATPLLIPIAIGLVILAIFAALYITFRAVANRERELGLVEQAQAGTASGRQQIAQVLTDREAGKLTPEEAVAALDALGDNATPAPGPSPSAGMWDDVKKYLPWVAGAVGVAFVLPALGALRPQPRPY